METKIDLKKLQKEIPYQWRVQSFSKNKPSAACVAYIDARDVMRLLDEVVGPENWQDDYRVINNHMFAGIGIFVNGAWVWKWDIGTESQTEKEKGQVSDAFKRAAVKWGIGRFLYDMPLVYVDANAKKGDADSSDGSVKKYPMPIDSQGKVVYDVTLLINSKKKN